MWLRHPQGWILINRAYTAGFRACILMLFWSLLPRKVWKEIISHIKQNMLVNLVQNGNTLAPRTGFLQLFSSSWSSPLENVEKSLYITSGCLRQTLTNAFFQKPKKQKKNHPVLIFSNPNLVLRLFHLKKRCVTLQNLNYSAVEGQIFWATLFFKPIFVFLEVSKNLDSTVNGCLAWYFYEQARVVWRLDNALHGRNHYTMDRDLSSLQTTGLRLFQYDRIFSPCRCFWIDKPANEHHLNWKTLCSTSPTAQRLVFLEWLSWWFSLSDQSPL